jgi:hypothetical protein
MGKSPTQAERDIAVRQRAEALGYEVGCDQVPHKSGRDYLGYSVTDKSTGRELFAFVTIHDLEDFCDCKGMQTEAGRALAGILAGGPHTGPEVWM